jgi:translation initiation factor IF-1
LVSDANFEVEAYKWGKMKKFSIKLLPGDWVQCEINEYDISKGRIVYRYKGKPNSHEWLGKKKLDTNQSTK